MVPTESNEIRRDGSEEPQLCTHMAAETVSLRSPKFSLVYMGSVRVVVTHCRQVVGAGHLIAPSERELPGVRRYSPHLTAYREL